MRRPVMSHPSIKKSQWSVVVYSTVSKAQWEGDTVSPGQKREEYDTVQDHRRSYTARSQWIVAVP